MVEKIPDRLPLTERKTVLTRRSDGREDERYHADADDRQCHPRHAPYGGFLVAYWKQHRRVRSFEDTAIFDLTATAPASSSTDEYAPAAFFSHLQQCSRPHLICCTFCVGHEKQ
jgi:hypothetical protein